MKVAFLFFAVIASASAFMPATPMRAMSVRPQIKPKSETTMQMSLDMLNVDTIDTLSQLGSSILTASSSSDFGGLAGPIAGLGFLVGLIVVTQGPPE
mmetsp:Transcript_54731/g.74802  ORF Transcript_54731/g.74802 Transcript_54731/m.74802 type:complete len:97 (-) Transcript_54731:386-676(-)